jgi:hypothetical protein
LEEKNIRGIKVISIVLFLLFLCIAISSSISASINNGPNFKITKITVIKYFQSPYVPIGIQRIRCEVKNIGPYTTNYNWAGEAFRYSFFKKPYLAGGGNTGVLTPPSKGWQPNEIKVLDVMDIYDKPFLKNFPIVYHIWIAVWNGFLNKTPDDILIDRIFLIWGYMIIPIKNYSP